MSLLLKDFSNRNNKNITEKREEEYLNKIKALKEEIQNLKVNLIKEKEAAYQQGFSDGKVEGYKLAKEEYDNLIKKLGEEKDRQTKEILKDYLHKIEENIENIKKNYQNILLQTSEILSDSITEILEFLYLSEEKKDLVYNQIIELLEEFFVYQQVYIKVGNKELAEIFRAKNFEVEIDPNLKGLDFIVDFREFKIENRIEEKLRIIKDEIKREIKKLSEV